MNQALKLVCNPHNVVRIMQFLQQFPTKYLGPKTLDISSYNIQLFCMSAKAVFSFGIFEVLNREKVETNLMQKLQKYLFES